MDSDNICADKDGFFPEAIDSSKTCQVNDCNSYNSNSTVMPLDSWIDESDVLTVHSKHDNSNYNLESELKKAETELLAELEKAELEEKRQKKEDEAKYKSLLEEVERLKHSDLQKDGKISELTELVTSLKRNLCSLYKTAKFEIERKDSLLHEAHKKLDRVLNQNRKGQVKREYSHPCEASNPKEKSCSKNSASHTSKDEVSVTKENSSNRNSSNNTDKFEDSNPKENPCPKNSTSHSYKTSYRKYEKNPQRAVSIERDSNSRSDYRNHTKTSSSEAKSSHRDTYNHRSHYRHNSDSRKDTKHENTEKRKDLGFHHISPIQPTLSDNDICSVQNKQRDLKCDERKPGDGKEDHSSDQDSRHNLRKRSFQKDISKSAHSHMNETAQKMKKWEIQGKSSERLALACASRKQSISRNASSLQASRHSFEKQTQKNMSESAQSHMNEISQKVTKCEIQEDRSEKLALAYTSRKCSSSRNASSGENSKYHFEKHNFQKSTSKSAEVLINDISQKTTESNSEIQERSSEKLTLAYTPKKLSSSRNASCGGDSRHPFEKHILQKDTSESAEVLMNEISQMTTESNCEIHEKNCEKLAVACGSRKLSLSRNASVQTDELKLDGISRDLTKTNGLFYNILPDTLKDSFNEYEQKQITTLNKLKQSFVNYYIENQDRSKRSRTSFKFPCDFTADILGISSSEPLICYKPPADIFMFKNNLTCSEQYRSSLSEIGYMPKADDFITDNFENQIMHINAAGELTKVKMQTITKSESFGEKKEDVLKLYRYQNSKVPFLVKRKFGLLNNRKKN